MAAQQQQQQQQTTTNNIGKTGVDIPAKVITNPFQQAAKPFRRNIPINDSVKLCDSSKGESVKTSVATVVSSDAVASTKECNSREGSPSSKQRPREQPRDVAVNSMKQLELVKKN